jgi:glycosyltransferase involved in cell wall biosynthesis
LQGKIVWHARNFGSMAAIRTGMTRAEGDFTAIMSADLQEPESLLLDFHALLAAGECDLAIGTRRSRADGSVDRASSGMYWRLYRRLVQPEMPPGGTDVFGCTRQIREAVVQMSESNTSLIGLLFWVGYRRALVPFDRLPRLEGKSGWTFRRKVRYMLDSVFSFTDLPINLLLVIGAVGIAAAGLFSVALLISWWLGHVDGAGYTPLMLAILGMGSLLLFGLGVVGSYIWRAYENTKARPLALMLREETFPKTPAT